MAINSYMLTSGDKGLTNKKKRFLDTAHHRRATENAFRIVASVFRAFYSKINLSPKKATKVVLAAVFLHNLQYLQTKLMGIT